MSDNLKLAYLAHQNAKKFHKLMDAHFREDQDVAERQGKRLYNYMARERKKLEARKEWIIQLYASGPHRPTRMSTGGGVPFAPRKDWYTGSLERARAARAMAKAAAHGAKRAMVAAAKRLAAERAAAK